MLDEIVAYSADNTDPDNMFGAVALARLFRKVIVVVTGRHTRKGNERQILQDDAARMCGMLDHLDCKNASVFTGLIPPATIIPDNRHIDETCLRLPGDEKKRPHGNFSDATAKLRQLAKHHRINIVGAGPFGEVNAWLRDPQLKGKIGHIFCQYGPMGFGNVKVIGGGKLGFNPACDPTSARQMMLNKEVDIYLNTTDTTKAANVGFTDARQIAALGVNPSLVKVEHIFWEKALRGRGENMYPHDVHPVFALAAKLGDHRFDHMFDFREVRIKSIGSRGELNASFESTPVAVGKRFVARHVDGGRFKAMLGRMCH